MEFIPIYDLEEKKEESKNVLIQRFVSLQDAYKEYLKHKNDNKIYTIHYQEYNEDDDFVLEEKYYNPETIMDDVKNLKDFML